MIGRPCSGILQLGKAPHSQGFRTGLLFHAWVHQTPASPPCPPMIVFHQKTGVPGPGRNSVQLSGKSCLTSSSSPCFTQGKRYVKIHSHLSFPRAAIPLNLELCQHEQVFASDLEMGPTVRLEMIQVE